MNYHNLLKFSEMLYFALKIVSRSERAYEPNLGQVSYNTLLEQMYLPKLPLMEV